MLVPLCSSTFSYSPFPSASSRLYLLSAPRPSRTVEAHIEATSAPLTRHPLTLRVAPRQHPAFKPFMFLDLLTGEQARRGGGSLSNSPEAILAVNVYVTLKRAFGEYGPPGSGDENGIMGRVGVITPYSQQVQELKKKFQVSGNAVLRRPPGGTGGGPGGTGKRLAASRETRSQKPLPRMSSTPGVSLCRVIGRGRQAAHERRLVWAVSLLDADPSRDSSPSPRPAGRPGHRVAGGGGDKHRGRLPRA